METFDLLDLDKLLISAISEQINLCLDDYINQDEFMDVVTLKHSEFVLDVSEAIRNNIFKEIKPLNCGIQVSGGNIQAINKDKGIRLTIEDFDNKPKTFEILNENEDIKEIENENL